MFLSVVSRSSKPAASATDNRSPLARLSHPRSIASTTVWPWREYFSGTGTPLSKRMSINRARAVLRPRRRVKAPRRKFKHDLYLFAGYVKPVHNFLDRGSRFQDLKHGRNGHAGISEYPFAAAFAA